MRSHGEVHFLAFDAIRLISHQVQFHPLIGTLALLGLFGIVLLILKRTFDRLGVDVFIFALIVTSITLILGGSLAIFLNFKGISLVH